MDTHQLLQDKIDEFLAAWPAGSALRVLEVACGSGLGSEVLRDRLAARHGHPETHLYHSDLDLARMTLCRRRLRPAGEPLLFQADLCRLPAADASLDAVAAFNIFHALQRRKFAREMRRVLRPGGRVLTYDRVPTVVAVSRLALIFDRDQLDQLAAAPPKS